MIYTVTLNPSVDYYMRVNGTLSSSVPNKISSCTFVPGGKGINVSGVLCALGVKSISVAPVGGKIGEFYKSLLEKSPLDCVFIDTGCETRINVKAGCIDTVYELNARGGELSDDAVNALFEKLSPIGKGDTVIISGSTPACKRCLYGEITSYAVKKGAAVVADTTGEDLLQAVKNGAFLIKPNEDELRELFEGDTVSSAEKLCDMGAELVCVSSGADGAYLIGKNVRYFCKAPKIDAENTVGAGDSLLAGFIYAYNDGKPLADCLKSGVAAGSCRVSTPAGRDFDKALYTRLYEGLTVCEI